MPSFFKPKAIKLKNRLQKLKKQRQKHKNKMGNEQGIGVRITWSLFTIGVTNSNECSYLSETAKATMNIAIKVLILF